MATAPSPTLAQTRTESLTLEQPIRRGETVIESVMLRKPIAGELRGLQLQSLMQGDVNTILAVVPRISVPSLIAQEVEQMDVADFTAVASIITGFFMSRAEQSLMAKVMGAIDTETSTP